MSGLSEARNGEAGNNENLREKTILSEMIYRGRILNLRRDTVVLPDGRTAVREVVEFARAVAVVALTEEKEVILVRQYRHPVGDILLELPAGKANEGEDLLVCAQRELTEETGYCANHWEKILSFYTTPGFTSEEMHIFLARDLQLGTASPDADEFIRVEKVPLARCRELIAGGEIRDAKSVAGLSWVLLNFTKY